jgi:hypothetical protein
MVPSKEFLPKTYDTEMGGKQPIKEEEEDENENLFRQNHE